MKPPLIWQIALVVITVTGASGVAWYYWMLNIQYEAFVGILGCGCKPHFNTNDLTMVVSGILILPSLWSMVGIIQRLKGVAAFVAWVTTSLVALVAWRQF